MQILIAGASIAGPALAFWLVRQGHDVTVIERAPALRRGGNYVDIRGSALAVVERMGLAQALRSLGSDTLSNALVDERGRRFGKTPRGFGVIDPDDIEILRGDLAHVLHEATRHQARYRFGETIASLTQHASGVDVTFESGSRQTFDLVIGADGVHSQTRALAFGPEQRFLRPLGSCMAIFSAPNHLGLDREQLLFSALRRIASVKSYDQNRSLQVAVFFAHSGPFDPLDVPAQRALVAGAFADAGWEFPTLLDVMRSADDFYCDLTCQIRTDSLCAGRVALVGDAAYCPSPLSGQGTSLALAGAYLLSAELARSPDPRAALRRYDEAMLPFARLNQDIALDIGRSFAPETTFQVHARRLAMRLLPRLPGSQFMMKLAMRGIRDAARSLSLPPADLLSA